MKLNVKFNLYISQELESSSYYMCIYISFTLRDIDHQLPKENNSF